MQPRQSALKGLRFSSAAALAPREGGDGLLEDIPKPQIKSGEHIYTGNDIVVPVMNHWVVPTMHAEFATTRIDDPNQFDSGFQIHPDLPFHPAFQIPGLQDFRNEIGRYEEKSIVWMISQSVVSDKRKIWSKDCVRILPKHATNLAGVEFTKGIGSHMLTEICGETARCRSMPAAVERIVDQHALNQLEARIRPHGEQRFRRNEIRIGHLMPLHHIQSQRDFASVARRL
jgi:hypothetical protein